MVKKGIWQSIEGGVAAPKGFYADGVQAEIRYKDKYDVALIFSQVQAQGAAVYTRNLVKAHPLCLSQTHLENGLAQAIVINSGNANACMGESGDQAALAMAREVSAQMGVALEDVVVASTGVIGEEMPMERVLKGIQAAAAEVRAGIAAVEKKQEDETPEGETGNNADAASGARRAALAIMTTDLTVKERAYELPCSQGGLIRMGGMAKGSGMIHPNMGTMLGFLTTDAQIAAPELQRILREAVDESFNMVTVDGDTSTNDMVAILANGASGVSLSKEDMDNFTQMLNDLCKYLAQEIARDGEGASKFLEIAVSGAETKEDARKIARGVCGSSLVKTAIFGADANWGRILMAAGYAGGKFDPGFVDIWLGDLPVAQAGRGLPFSEEKAAAILSQKDVQIRLDLHLGNETATAWGCDLTYEYVKINGSYRS